MSVSLRGSKFHYRFHHQGNDYSGPCEGCVVPTDANAATVKEIRERALQYEQRMREEARSEQQFRKEADAEIRRNRTVRALVENYRYELTGGKPVLLSEAYDLAVEKPSPRGSGAQHGQQRTTYWRDFVAYMTDKYPDITDLASVRKAHCEAYVTYLVKHGRYVRTVDYQRQRKTVTYQAADRLLAPKTIKEIAGVARWVFGVLAEDAGLINNPWDKVVLPRPNAIDREIFTPAELRLIWEGIQTDDFCRPLFIIAANSGLTEGDICTMKWSEFDWATGYFRRSRRKTGTPIQLPLIPEFVEYLCSLPRLGEYVLPDHAALYLRQSSAVSRKVKAFLNGLGIVTTVELLGRRAVSIKDLHSMRHVFCYRAKRAGIPESIIAKFVGHRILAMTQHYADHDTDEDLRQEIQKLPSLFLGVEGSGELNSEVTARRRLAELAYSLPIAQVEQLVRAASAPPRLLCEESQVV